MQILQYNKSCVSHTHTYQHSIYRDCLKNVACQIYQRQTHLSGRGQNNLNSSLNNTAYSVVKCDKKSVSRWRRVIQGHIADRGERQSFKDAILENCDRRDDRRASEMRIRMLGSSADLHTTDVQCHKDCYSSFLSLQECQCCSVINVHKCRT